MQRPGGAASTRSRKGLVMNKTARRSVADLHDTLATPEQQPLFLSALQRQQQQPSRGAVPQTAATTKPIGNTETTWSTEAFFLKTLLHVAGAFVSRRLGCSLLTLAPLLPHSPQGAPPMQT